MTSISHLLTHRFTFMGTGAGCGVPAFFCDCPACQEARANPRARRGDCGAMVQSLASREAGGKTVLIDTPPDVRHQLNREGVFVVDDLLMTHGHSDHIGGMEELEYMVQLKSKAPLPTYGSPGTLETLAHEYHYMTYCLDMHEVMPGETIELDGVRYTALPVHHAPGTYGYLIETPSTRLFYASDTGRLPEATAERIRGVDYLALDATYWKSCPTDQHHSVQEAIEEGFELGAGTIFLTHLCMHYAEPITLTELENYLQRYDGRVLAASDGLAFSI